MGSVRGYRPDEKPDLRVDWAAIARHGSWVGAVSGVRTTLDERGRGVAVLETCKLHDVDPAAYLHAAVVAADRGELLLPWSFAADR